MFNGTIKKLENIEINEQVMGPDFHPRLVLSKYSGIDNIFKIIPSKGNYFICNGSQILTLKGVVPYIKRRHDRPSSYIIQYSEKGCEKTKAFVTEHEATNFINISERSPLTSMSL